MVPLNDRAKISIIVTAIIFALFCMFMSAQAQYGIRFGGGNVKKTGDTMSGDLHLEDSEYIYFDGGWGRIYFGTSGLTDRLDLRNDLMYIYFDDNQYVTIDKSGLTVLRDNYLRAEGDFYVNSDDDAVDAAIYFYGGANDCKLNFDTSDDELEIDVGVNVTGTVTASVDFRTLEVQALDANGLKLYEDGGAGILIEDGGMVGIGTGDPTEALHVIGDIKASVDIHAGTNITVGGTVDGIDIAALDGAVLKKDASVALTADWDIGDGRMIQADKIRARDAAGLMLYEDGGAGIFVEDGGNVGVGTADPTDKFHVQGNIVVSGTVDGVDVGTLSAGVGARGAYSKLVVKYASATTVDIDADLIVCEDASGNLVDVTDVDLTATITTAGLNGLDESSETTATWYYVYVQAKSDSTNACVLSTDTTPVTSTDYDYKKLVGFVRNDDSGDFYDFIQRGDLALYQVPTAWGILNSGQDDSWTNVACNDYAPPTSERVLISALLVADAGGSRVMYIGNDAKSGTQIRIDAVASARGNDSGFVDCTASQVFDYYLSNAAASASITLVGYLVEI